MIAIELKRSNSCYELFVKGHADYDIAGKDIVCSAVSILVYTLLESIKERDIEKPTISILNPGNTYIKVDAKSEKIDAVNATFSVICNGFLLLSKSFPKNVEFFGGHLLETKK